MRFRPEHDPRSHRVVAAEHDPEPGGPVQWEDNWLSNAFAWASYRIVPGWCQDEQHWTSRFTQYLFTDCPCCMIFRGVTVGMVVGGILGLLLGAAVTAAVYEQ